MKIIKCMFLLFWAVQITAFTQTLCDDIRVTLLKVDEMIVEGKLDLALEELTKIKNNPDMRNCDNIRVVDYKINDIKSKLSPPSLTVIQMVDLGNDYLNGINGKTKDYAKAKKWFEMAAEQGNAEAYLSIGWMYDKGLGVSQDLAEAIKWYRKAAEQGNVLAQNNLGVMFRIGKGVPKDYTEALKWFRKSADQGNDIGMTNVGYMYDEGLGVPQDYAEAERYYRMAAELGDATAQYNLGVMFENGKGVKKNLSEAKLWYEIAAVQGNENAKKRLNVLNGK